MKKTTIGTAAGFAATAGLVLILAGDGIAYQESGNLEPLTPVDVFLRAARDLQDKAHKAIEEKEYEDVADLTGALAELAQLQSLRDNAEYSKWAKAVSAAAARASIAAGKEQEGPTKSEIATLAKLMEESAAKAANWAGAKSVKGKYTPLNKTVKSFMDVVSDADRLVKKALQKESSNLKATADGQWLSADLGNVAALLKAEPEWKSIAVKHRDMSVELAKVLAAGDRDKAKAAYGLLQANCKACHDKFQ